MNNLTLTAMLVAILAATQGVSFLLRSWQNRLYQAFAILCATVFLANVGLTLATIDGARAWHVLHLLGALATGPAAVHFFLRLLRKPQPRGAGLRPLLVPVGLALGLLVIVAYDPAQLKPVVAPPLEPFPGDDLWIDLRPPAPFSSPAGGLTLEGVMRALFTRPLTHFVALLTGGYIFGCYGFILANILDRRARTRSRVERARLTSLALLGAFTMLGSLLQAGRPYLGLEPPLWPIGGLAQLLFISFLSQVILLYRLLDLLEMLSKGLIFLSQVAIIGAVYSALLVLFGDRRNWLNLAITIFLASGVVSLFHEPLRRGIERAIYRVFSHRRYELMVRLHALEREMPRFLTLPELLDGLMSALTEVPRITHAAIFLWDEKSRSYSCLRRAGPEGWPPPATVAATSPLSRELLSRKRPFGYEDLVRELEGQEAHRVEISAALSALKRLDGEVAIPFIGEGLLFGFIILKDDSVHEGFTHDELDLLQQLADRAGVIIQNSDAIQRLKERDRLAALGQMAAGLAHEIRNPLGAIRGAAQYLADETQDETNQEFLEIIVEEVDRLNKVVTDFLDYSRPLKIRLEPCDLNRLVTPVAGLLTAQGLPSTLELKLDLEPDLPPVPVDQEKMKQVLLNLLQNAVQAMSGAGTLTIQTRRAPRVAWTGARHGEATLERVEVRVIDTGVGISPEDLEKLFIPFFTTKPGGTGLGLAISQRLVQAHDGELEVQSTPGQGTRVTVRLPLLEPAQAVGSGEGVAPPAGGVSQVVPAG